MEKQAFNPYLPSWEYIPDGEPYVFGDRVYVYGSHDYFRGSAYCLGDYVCWSAPADELGDWRYEGVIYRKTADPLNKSGRMCLYAPDVTVGPDGRYYLYYVLDKVGVVSVAVCDEPAGEYRFYGYVQDKAGNRLGEREGDEPQFDPGVLTEGSRTYMYTGFCPPDDTSRHGSMVTVLGEDMLTIEEETAFLTPSKPYSEGSSFAGHEFFEASSIRKRGDTYYFIYSSIAMHELCYATSKSPVKDFIYGGVVSSNCDMHIDSYKPADMPVYYGGNNHGSIVEIAGKWYIFYHRHTDGTNFSRQGCAEQIKFREDGSIVQPNMTSCGLNGGPLTGKGEYPAYIACNLFCRDEAVYTAPGGSWMDCRFPKITQDGGDYDAAECGVRIDDREGYILNMRDGATAGFKYFDCQGITSVSVKVRGYANGYFEIKNARNGNVLCKIEIGHENIWTQYEGRADIPNGVQALYFTYRGQGSTALKSFTLK